MSPLSRGQIITGSLRVSGSWSAPKLHGRKPLQVGRPERLSTKYVCFVSLIRN
jgi:hypothetical protein